MFNWQKALFLALGLQLTCPGLSALTPYQLATCFEHIHELSFAQKYLGRANYCTFENFISLGQTAAKCENKNIAEIFGFSADEVGITYLKMLFKVLKDQVIKPDFKVISFFNEPLVSAFWLALDVATKFMQDREPREAGVGNSITLLRENFLVAPLSDSVPGIDHEMIDDLYLKAWQIFFTEFGHRLAVAIKQAEQEALTKSPKNTNAEEPENNLETKESENAADDQYASAEISAS